jgi:putative flavoprotein involved in K+ transport
VGDLSAHGFNRPPLGLKATVEQTGRIPTLADELAATPLAREIAAYLATTSSSTTTEPLTVPDVD